MIDKLKRYFDLLPFLAPIIYFLGFIIINGYLSNYGYSDYKILSFTYLKAGILIFVLFLIIFLSIWFSFDKDTMSDDYTKSWPSLLISLNNILLVTYLMSNFLIDYKLLSNHKVLSIIFFICVLLFGAFHLWRDNKKPKNNIGFLLLILPGILLLLTLNLIFAFNCKLIMYLLIFNISISVLISLSLGIYGDKKYKERLIVDLIFMIVISFSFGSKIYGMIPMKIGGGEPYQIIIDNSCLDTLKKNCPIDTINVIYENDERFIFQRKTGNVFTIKKDEIKCFYIVKK